jgi:hypothetical protein
MSEERPPYAGVARTSEPDFDQIARQIVFSVQMAIEGAGRHPEPPIAEQLRLIWNARGAADRAQLDVARSNIALFPQARALAEMLDRALRTVDR